MNLEKPKFLAVHFNGDFLEHAAFVESEEEGELLSCLVRPGDHWDYILIPIETAAVAPWLLTACKMALEIIEDEGYTDEIKTLKTAIEKAEL